jgi:hypothetical protein
MKSWFLRTFDIFDLFGLVGLIMLGIGLWLIDCRLSLSVMGAIIIVIGIKGARGGNIR